ncbi:MAG TPA: hypothetical protein VFI42_06105 [Thermomicrobiaceae bacterium]|nr:hypothetical protein [Thermomicrobiaceae bacterium]
MAVQLKASADLEAVEPGIDESLRRLEHELNALTPAEVAAVVEAAARALEERAQPIPSIAATLSRGLSFSPAERVVAEFEVLARSFLRRQQLLADALSSAQVATLLKTSRQTPHDRFASGSLLAVMDRGALRFPAWQFDPDGPDGVVAGLPHVLRALDVSPMAKVSWLTRASSVLDGATPLAALKTGRIEEVVALARAVGLD